MNTNANHLFPRINHLCRAVAAALTFATGAMALPSYGETIEVPVGQQAEEKWTMDRPTTGMSKTQVQSFFGDPVEMKGAVGDPPISRWIYEDFVVYFEYDHVVHTVLKYKGNTQQQAQVQNSR